MTILAGYWESWKNVNLWNYYPNMCVDYVCPNVSLFLQYTAPYTTVFYAFNLLSNNWYSGYDPDKYCSKYNQCGGAACPFCSETENNWGDQQFRVVPACRQMGQVGITMMTTTSARSPTNALNVFREIGRLLHQHPDGPKQFFVSFGGWSDCITFPLNDDDLTTLANMMADFVIYSFADGIDLDFEHFSIQANGDTPWNPEHRQKQLGQFARLIQKIKDRFDALTDEKWFQILQDTNAWLDSSAATNDNTPYYLSTKVYLQDLCTHKQRPPFQIVYTPRFNAFVQKSTTLGFRDNFVTDGEGLDLFDSIADVAGAINAVNFMTYDQAFPYTGAPNQTADGYIGYFTKMIDTCPSTLPKKHMRLGIEPGVQAGDPTALDMTNFSVQIADLVKTKQLGGVFVWSINIAAGIPQLDLNQIGQIIDAKNPSSMTYTPAGNDGMIADALSKIPSCHPIMMEMYVSSPSPSSSSPRTPYFVWAGIFAGLSLLCVIIGWRTKQHVYLAIATVCAIIMFVFIAYVAGSTKGESFAQPQCQPLKDCKTSKECAPSPPPSDCAWICV